MRTFDVRIQADRHGRVKRITGVGFMLNSEQELTSETADEAARVYQNWRRRRRKTLTISSIQEDRRKR